MTAFTEESAAESVRYIREHIATTPSVGVILGSGLGDFADSLQETIALDSSFIPHYPTSTVQDHKGRLVFGKIARSYVMIFQGRVHFYEANSLDAVLQPIRIAQRLGVEVLIVTNAAGAVERHLQPGNLMVIIDQINLTGETFSFPQNKRQERFVLYSARLIDQALQEGQRLGISLKKGVYAGVKGPSYETAAEIEMIHRIGGDAVGMSTVLEASVAARLGIEVLGISVITNLGTGIGRNKLNHAEVTDVAKRIKNDFRRLLLGIIRSL